MFAGPLIARKRQTPPVFLGGSSHASWLGLRDGAARRLRSVGMLAAALGAIAAFPAVASAGSMSWSAPIALDTGTTLYAVACPSTTQCTAVGGGR